SNDAKRPCAESNSSETALGCASDSIAVLHRKSRLGYGGVRSVSQGQEIRALLRSLPTAQGYSNACAGVSAISGSISGCLRRARWQGYGNECGGIDGGV